MVTIIGWDIGGVNTKAVRLEYHVGEMPEIQATSRYFEIWHDRNELLTVLREVAMEMNFEKADAMAVTMTAELSDVFRTKREGVLFIFDCLTAAFPPTPLYALSLDGDFAPLERARERPLDFAAANWLAVALFLAERYSDCLLIDVGTTTTDIIPIRAGKVASQGRTDLARLAAGELVYTGALRTNPSAIVSQVPVKGRMCRVSPEYFAIMGDVYLVLRYLSAEEYVCPTPDGRSKTGEDARERLARLVCADGEMLTEEETMALARYLHEKQVQQITEALFQVLSRMEGDYRPPLISTGLGRFLGVESGRRLGLTIIDLADEWGPEMAAVTPSLAVAHLLAERWVKRGREE